jgi:pimeloyl-ACP methyl ester carboxylesterase
MDLTPFRIQKFSLDPTTQTVTLAPVDLTAQIPIPHRGIPGYFVVSTAPPNIEDAVEFSRADWEQTGRGIDAIATDLYRIYRTFPTAPELVVVIHGYNTHEEGIKVWYKDIFRYLNQTDPVISQKHNTVFIGYRWSSETLSLAPRNLWQHFQALPPAPKTLLTLGTFLSVAWLMWSWFAPQTWLDLLIGGLLSLTTSASALVAGLLILRLSGYFRDVYRATNFGVLDLVELLRRLDKALIDTTALDLHRQNLSSRDVYDTACQQWETIGKKVKLTFIGHSMGALVVTNVVRILSDVFDTRSVAKQPPSDIGRTLSLERLILAGPDIPVLSIISSRANFLASSLRRFNETYLFSNEGDLALRLASTAANYISFPSATRSRGYRLGNVAITHFKEYGISNLQNLRQYFLPQRRLSEAIQADPDDILKNLYVTHSWGPGDGYLSLSDLFFPARQRGL